MKQCALISIVLIALLSSWTAAQTPVSELQQTKITIPDIEVTKGRKLFVYCMPPSGSKVTITLTKPGSANWTDLDFEESTDEVWTRKDFALARQRWPSKVAAVCTVESTLPLEEVQRGTRLFTLVADEPLNWADVHESHTYFEFNPVFDKHQKSGTFYYELPWAATVIIKIQKWTSEGPKPTDIEIKDQAPGGGIKTTKWDNNHKFDSMADGDYQAKITGTKVTGKNEKKIKDQANIYIIIQFRRGIH